MKILLVVPEFPPHNIGGGGEVYRQIARNLKNFGNEVIVMYGYFPTKSILDKIVEFEKNGIKYIQVPEIPTPKKFPFLKTTLPITPTISKQIDKIIKSLDIEVANVHGYGSFFPSQISKLLVKNKIPYVITLHGAPVSPDKKGGLIKAFYQFYKKYFGNFLLANAKYISAVSRYTTTFEEFQKYIGKIKIITNGIDLDEIAEYNRKNEVSIFGRYFRKEKNTIIFFSLGRLEWLKGFQHFINILPEIKNDKFDVKYCIAGTDNGYKSDLVKLVYKFKLEKNVFFMGQLNFDEKCNALKNCDYVVVPSEVENFPAVPLEALSFGKIPIVNNAGGMSEIVKDNVNGIICDVTDKEMFAKRVSEILENEKLNKKIKKNLSEVEKFDWKNQVKEYEKILFKASKN